MYKFLRSTLQDTKVQKISIAIFFAVFLILGLSLVSDHGVSVDESFEAHTADINYSYLTGQSDRLLTYDDRYYGVLLTLPLHLLSRFFPDSRSDLLMRHTLTWATFYLSGFFFFSLLRKMRFSRWLALLGVVLYYFHPHLFSHSFYNLKDIPFTAAFIVNLYTLTLLIEHRSKRFALLHGVFTGILVILRVPGVLMIMITAMIAIWLVLLQRKTWLQILQLAVVYAIAVPASLVAFMPSLWHDPINELRVMFSMSLIEWPYKELFMGQLIPGVSIPRIYLPVSFAVTTPLLYLAIGLLGTFVLAYQLLVKKEIVNPSHIIKTLPYFGFYLPMLVIMIDRPILYNGWRHSFFIYPAFVMLVLYGIQALSSWIPKIPSAAFRRSAMAFVFGLFAWQAAEQIRFFVISHPYEHVYYNRLAGPTLSDARLLYPMDYWGLAYKESLEAILSMDSSDHIRVLGYHPLLAEQNLRILPKKDRDRIVIAYKDEPYDYFIQHFRNDFTEVFPDRELIYEIRVDGALVNAVYKYTGK